MPSQLVLMASVCLVQCDALRGLVELPLPLELQSSELPVKAIAEAVRGRVSHTQMEHASCVRKEASDRSGLTRIP